MKTKLISAAVASVVMIWSPLIMARQTVTLPYIFGVAPGDSVGQTTGVDATGSGLLTINPNININSLNDVGGGITSSINNVASTLFVGNSTVTGFTGTNLIRFLDITAGANASTVNFNGDVFTTTFNLSGTGTVNFNGSLNPGIVAASSNFAGDGFINVGTNQLFNSAITTNTANTGTLTLNGGSRVIGAIGGANGLRQINIVGGNASVTGAIQAQQFNLGINTLTTVGALTTNAAGVINTTFASNSVFGKIIVNGNSAINAGGITVIPTVTGALTNGTTYRIVEAPSGTDNAVVSVINNNPRFTFAGLPTTLGKVDIRLVGVAPLATLVTAPAALLVAPILDNNAPVTTDLRAIQDAIAILPDAASINNSLAQLAPGTTNLAAPWVAGQTTRLFEDLWMARLDEIQDQCCEVCKPMEAETHKCKTSDERGTWWAKAFGSRGNQDNFNNMYGYDTKAYGLMVAFDKLITDETRVGFAGGYANTKIDGNNSSGHSEIDSYQLTAYLNHTMGDAFIQGALTAGVDRYNGQRSIVFTGINRSATANFEGQQYTAIATVGKHFYFGKQGVITPIASLQASRIQVDSYNENGAGDANLLVSSQDYDFVQSSLGIKAERVFKLGNNSYSPEAHFKWLHDFNSTTMQQQAAFTGSPTKFKTNGIDQDRELFNIGAGFTFLSCKCDDKSWSLKALYDYKWNESGYSSNQFSAMATLKF